MDLPRFFLEKTRKKWNKSSTDKYYTATSHKLLRGERKSSTERAETTEETESTPKAEKQRQRLRKSTLSQYQNRTYIAMGVSVIGVIVALICNLDFL